MMKAVVYLSWYSRCLSGKNGQIASGVVPPRKNVTNPLSPERKPAHSQHAPAEEHVGFSFGTQMVQSQVDENYCTRNNKTDAHTNREHADNVTQSDAQSRSFWSVQCATNAFQSPYSWPNLWDATADHEW